jgi:ElaB/YqjD/DUF883 family membrane-anchored ribosome-binding protein
LSCHPGKRSTKKLQSYAHCKTNGHNRQVKSISANNHEIPILFYNSCNFFQNRTQRKSQQIQENRNNPLHHIRQQQNKTRHQQQKRFQKIFNNTETEQHTAENPWVTEEITEEIKKFLTSNENENANYQNL